MIIHLTSMTQCQYFLMANNSIYYTLIQVGKPHDLIHTHNIYPENAILLARS